MARAGTAIRRGPLIGTIVAVVVAVALVAGALLAGGYDARKVESKSTSVWAIRSSGQYGRVDTALGELDTVKDADSPHAVVQSGTTGVVYTDGYQKRWQVDADNPKDLVANASSANTSAAENTSTKSDSNGTSAAGGGGSSPAGTRQVISSGKWSVSLTDSGHVFVQNITAAGAAGKPAQVPSPTGRSGAATVATAAAVSSDGTIAMYTAKDRTVRTFDAKSARFTGKGTTLSHGPKAGVKTLMTIVGGTWVLADTGHDRLWVAGHSGSSRRAFAGDAVAENGTNSGNTAYFADNRGLIAVDLKSANTKRVATASGTPAAPTDVGGAIYAAWVGQQRGTMWSSERRHRVDLQVPNGVLGAASGIAPTIASNGSSAVLNETSTGLLWRIPSGTLIPLSQWKAQKQQQTQEQGVKVATVTQEEPPVAQPSTFGVRAGSRTLLPVLLNAHDPNKKDVLTIDPGSVSGLSNAGFGSLSLTDDNQQLVVDVTAQSGSATFTYAVTDGTLSSDTVTVTLNVSPDKNNSAPAWCGINNCLQRWPTAELVPGGTTVVPVMNAWVDPDGDPMVLESAVKDDQKAPITVVPTSDGSVAIRHNDPNAGGGTYGVTVTVLDGRGVTTTKTLSVNVSADASLEVQQSAVVASVGQRRTIDIDRYVRGGSGSYRLVDAVANSNQQSHVTVSPNAAVGTIELSADATGQYTVAVTVQDTQTHVQDSGQLRFSVIANPQRLTIPPLTAFVQGNSDTTIDVLDTAQNTSGRVLALANATTNTANLTADVVNHERLRLSGSTKTGNPGLIGTAKITIADGSGENATGTVAVFLAPRATGVAPIAIPDAVTVRAGDQIDIPVTSNDIAPRGQQLTLSSTLDASGTDGELAFVSGSTVRYLAPSKAGTRTVRYSVFFANDPSQVSTASITITVVGTGQNHAPEPQQLSGRVTAGATVNIAVPTSGMDPDGDVTTLIGVDQPKSGQGSAAVTADGSTIQYTAPGNGVSGGQVRFSYRVADPKGSAATGTVTVAVLGDMTTVQAPIAYTDTVHAIVGSSNALTVEPLQNDIDPAGGTLKLVSLVPNAPEKPGSSEYDRLKKLIDPASNLAAGTVRLRPGDVQGTQSYIYTVRSQTSSSTSQGLIILNVTDDVKPEVPTITDTVVTLADRDDVQNGIDVVSGKVAWSAGDVGKLTLSVWGGSADKYQARGTKISGPVPKSGALVPFTLTGKDFAGRKSVAHGFLRIPALDNMPVVLRSNLNSFKVGEDSSRQIKVADAVSIGASDGFEVRNATTLPVQRANAACSASGDTVTYRAGRDAPWTDTCAAQVRVTGQSRWTTLPLPIEVEPKAPKATLSPLSRTIAPGETQTINLLDQMTGWEGGRVGNTGALDYHVAYSGSDFIVTQKGTTVTAEAKANATSGAVEPAHVTVTAFGGLAADLALRVGIAAKDTPRGATFTQACKVSGGPSCSVSVVGHQGEYDPFQGKPGSGLKLAGIGQVNCSVADVAVVGKNISASWPSGSKPAGGTCVVPYTVVDAQGRSGPGTLTLDIQGYPSTPSSLTSTGYSGSSVTLTVTLGDATNAHPGLSGVRIYEDGKAVGASCSSGALGTYTCTVSGLQNGQRHSFTARAVNSVGESGDTTAVATWAYQTPSIGSIAATSVGPVNRSTGTARVTLTAGTDVAAFQLASDSGATETVQRTGNQTTTEWWLPAGGRTITATPVSQFQPPTGGGGNTGESASTSVNIAGAPYFESDGSLKSISNTSLRLDNVRANGNWSGKNVSVLYAVWPDGQSEPSCRADGNGNPVMDGGQSSNSFNGLNEYQKYWAVACVGNGYAVAQSAAQSAWTFTTSPGVDGNYSYKVGTAPQKTTTGNYTTGAEWNDYTTPNVPSGGSNFETRYTAGATGRTSTNFSDLISSDRNPGTITAQYCWEGSICGSSSTISAETAPTTVNVNIASDATATPTVGDVNFSGSIKAPTDSTSPSASSSDVKVSITADATNKLITYTITFAGDFKLLDSVALTRPLAGATP